MDKNNEEPVKETTTGDVAMPETPTEKKEDEQVMTPKTAEKMKFCQKRGTSPIVPICFFIVT